MSRIFSEEALLALIETIVEKHHNNLSPTTVLSRSDNVFVDPDKRPIFEVLDYNEETTTFSLYIRKDFITEVLRIFDYVDNELKILNYTVHTLNLPEKETATTENKKSHQKKSSTKRKK